MVVCHRALPVVTLRDDLECILARRLVLHLSLPMSLLYPVHVIFLFVTGMCLLHRDKNVQGNSGFNTEAMLKIESIPEDWEMGS